MLVERPLRLLRAFYKGAIWRIRKKKKTIYLTFDDGPTPDITNRVLDILDSYNIKASFFCIGKNVKNNPAIYKDILSRGHVAGNHTHNHLKGFEWKDEKYIENVAEAAKHIKSNLFRPPYGRIQPSQLKALRKNYKVILWDLVTRDYNPKLSAKYILFNIKLLSRNGSVVVFHDSKKAEKNLFAVLPKAIKFWQEKGYEFSVL
ncbi:MAG: polysaccharide deacetylase family protein [Vallitaleaceae bacterium]|jgi:peptidoglycan/xylan/chitin deacetylase (PgdA/CDA1 family)|nr:polysaccharide deacetylase family protein [Vallitaleaceae bacterium]